MKSRVVIFGAGAIGRGLIGELVTANGVTPVFIEAEPGLAHCLEQAESYEVHLVGRVKGQRRVTGYRVLSINDKEDISEVIADCLFMVTAVGGPNLRSIAPLAVLGLKKRKKTLNILVCENWPHAENVLAEALLDAGCEKESFACICCSVERMVRRPKESLDLTAEGGETLYVDNSAWLGDLPDIEGLLFCDNIEAFYARKLYTNNAGHALLAYLGNLSDCQFIYEALEIPEIRNNLMDLLNVAIQALTKFFSMDRVKLERHVDDLVSWRFSNSNLADTVKRVARDPLRKLGTEERLVGLTYLLKRCSLSTMAVSRVIAAAMHYRDPNDPESVKLGEIIAQKGAGAILEDVCGFRKDETAYKECTEFYKSYS